MTPEQEVKLLKKTVKAQAKMIVAYRVGGHMRMPEWVFKSLDKAKAEYGDNLLKII